MQLTPPSKYEVWYANGKQEYTEPFIILKFSKEAADRELDQMDSIIEGLITFFSWAGKSTGEVTGGISIVVAETLNWLLRIGGGFIEDKYLKPDANGGITIYMAYHYWGNSKEGLDFTAWPIPGVPPEHWHGYINRQIRAFRRAKRVKAKIGNMAEASQAKPAYEFEVEDALDFAQFKTHQLQLPPAKQQDSDPPEEMAFQAASDSTFYERFKSCMDLQGLPTPSSAFKTIGTAVGTINAMYSLVVTYGTRITIAELVGAGLLSDALLVVGGLSAAYYLGACIGCGIYAGIGPYIPSP